MQKEIHSLYVLKAVCAFFVICIHYIFWGRNAFLPIIKIAVPCFYLVAGFFLVDSQGSIDLGRVQKQIKKLLCLLIAANSAYFVLSYCLGCLNLSDLLLPQTIIRFFLYGDVLAVHLWFMNAYIECLLIILFISKICGKVIVTHRYLPFICLLLLSAPLLGRYSFIFGRQFDEVWFRNYFNVAIPFMYFGALIRQDYKRILTNFIIKYFVWVLVVFLLLSYAEFGLQYMNSQFLIQGDLNIFTVPLSILFFLLCLYYPALSSKKWNWLITIGHYHSTNIYLYHFVFLDLLWEFSNTFMKSGNPAIPVFIFVLSILLSFIINKAKSVVSSVMKGGV